MCLNKNSFDLCLISFVFYARNSLKKQTENSGVLLNCQKEKKENQHKIKVTLDNKTAYINGLYCMFCFVFLWMLTETKFDRLLSLELLLFCFVLVVGFSLFILNFHLPTKKTPTRRYHFGVWSGRKISFLIRKPGFIVCSNLQEPW